MTKFTNIIRAAYRAPLGLAWTLGVHYLGVRLPQQFNGGKRVPGAIGFWGAGLAKIMGVRLHKVNERIGPMGDIIIANHMGFLDIPVLLTFFPALFLIKMEMRKVPYFGKCLEHHGHVFVERDKKNSRHEAGKGVESLLKDGDRVIIFPEGKASPNAKRLPFAPFTFVLAKRLNKRVEACVIDYLPDRQMLKWDVNRGMLPQLIQLLGHKRIDISVEFFPAEYVEDPYETAKRYHDMIEGCLVKHDRDREAQASGESH
jgi:1-acyl-sn-glycerol-3-phosphate acyltransferase